MKPIRSLLLSAGLGTRLRPITLDLPKCLVQINGKPILKVWIEKLKKINAEKILINTHYLSDQVDKFIDEIKNNKVDLQNFYEKELLGTAGTLIANKDFFLNSIGILIHADNFTKMDLKELIKAHLNKPKSCLLTMLTFDTINPESCGIVEIDSKGIVKDFHEKSNNNHGNLANGAVYVFEDDFLDWVVKYYPNASDFSTEVIPNMLGKIYTYHTYQPYIDIGTIESLKKACEEAKNLN